MDPNFWGPSIWRTIHSVAYESDKLASENTFSNLIYELSFVLPCETCRNHMQNYLKDHPIPQNNFFIWSVEFHNQVNIRLGKPIMSFEEASQIYAKASNCKNCEDSSNNDLKGSIFFATVIILSIIISFIYLSKWK